VGEVVALLASVGRELECPLQRIVAEPRLLGDEGSSIEPERAIEHDGPVEVFALFRGGEVHFRFEDDRAIGGDHLAHG
jgi:hypothetical protein